MMSLQSWWFLKTDRDDYIRTRELPRWNGVMLVGISRGVVGIGRGMQQVSQSKKQISRVKKKLFRGRFCF